MPLPPKDGAYSSDFGTTILAFQKLFQQFTVFRDPMACTNVVYLVGLGGMGMTPLALYLQKRGFRVYGWDDGELKPETKEWFKHTVTVTPKIPEDCGSMVYSSAIAEEHPLRREALERLLPSFQRGTFLAQVLGDRKVIGVVGSHGKTTTTAWIIHFLKSQSRPFDYLLGGFFCREYWPADHHPDSTWAILEIDESDGTLLQFSPEYTVVLNDDWDHPTHYPTAQKYTDTLKALCRQTHTGIVLSSTLPWEKEIKKPCLTFGPKGNFSARRKGTLWHLKGPSTSMDYDVPPIFFPNNLLAAVATTVTLTGQWPTSEDLLTFPGVKRRQEILFQTPFLSVVTDYAHHPTELQTYLSFARKRRRGKHWAVFEPHRYSRTRTFLKDFIAPLNLPDKTMLLPIYGASEPNENALTSENIARHLSHHEPIDFLQIPHFIQRLSAEKVPLTLHLLGAGNIEKWGQSWLKDLREGWYSRLQKIVKRCQRNRELKGASTLHIGGQTLFGVVPETEDELIALMTHCHQMKLPCVVLGNGSNVLIPEIVFNGTIVWLKGPTWQSFRRLSDVQFEVGGGLSLKKLLDLLEQNGIGGFEFLEGIPGTVGGALSTNAGTGSETLFNHLDHLIFVDTNGARHSWKTSDIRWEYRRCPTLENGAIVEATFSGEKIPPEVIQLRRRERAKNRQRTQPSGLSLGCFFRNPPGRSAGQLMDQLGLKATRRGGAYVSSQHANFILNDGTARFEDVVALARHLRRSVWEQTGIRLEPEVRLLGLSWDSFLR